MNSNGSSIAHLEARVATAEGEIKRARNSIHDLRNKVTAPLILLESVTEQLDSVAREITDTSKAVAVLTERLNIYASMIGGSIALATTIIIAIVK